MLRTLCGVQEVGRAEHRRRTGLNRAKQELLETKSHLLRKRRVRDHHTNDGAIGSEQEMTLDEQELQRAGETSAPASQAPGRR